MKQKPGHAFAEVCRRCNQAKDQEVFAGKIVKMSWMDQHILFPQKVDSDIFARMLSRYAHNAGPATLRVQKFTATLDRHLTFYFLKIFAYAREQKRLNRFTLLKQQRQRKLDRCGHRQE